MATDDTTTPISESALARTQSSPPSVGFARRTFTRRRSTQERIEEILETARSRAESLEGSGQPLHLTTMRSRSRPNVDSDINEEEGEPPLDETTFIAISAAPNYQSTATSTTSLSRERRARRESTSQNSSSAQPAPPAAMQENSAGRLNGHATGGESKIKTFLSQFRSIELENKGSTARDHLAIERTFLAWLRTSLAFASIGIAITQLFRLNTSIGNNNDGNSNANKAMHTLRQMGKPLGATFLGISIVILLLGYRRYFQSQQWVMHGKFPASRGTIILVALLAFALMIVSLVVVVVVGPTATELQG